MCQTKLRFFLIVAAVLFLPLKNIALLSCFLQCQGKHFWHSKLAHQFLLQTTLQAVTSAEHYSGTKLCSLQKKNELWSIGTSIHNNSLACFKWWVGEGGTLNKSMAEGSLERNCCECSKCFLSANSPGFIRLGTSDALSNPPWNKT